MCIYSPMPHTLSYCALMGKCALIRSNTVFGMEQHFLSFPGILFQKLTKSSKPKCRKMPNTDRKHTFEFFIIIWKCQKNTKHPIPRMSKAIVTMSENDKEFHLQYYGHFNNISVILGLWEGHYEFKGCQQ